MEKDGAYHVAAVDEGQQVRLSEDLLHFDEQGQSAKTSRLTVPGGDYRASPIEEVTVGVKAGGDFGLSPM